MGSSIKHQDPYEIPAHLIPPGMIYQWVAKKSFGQIDKQLQSMLDAGWTRVPYGRLEQHFRGRYRGDSNDEISVGGQVLMERIRDVSKIARDKEMDQAVINSGSGRDISIDLVSRINLSAFEIETAKSMSLSSSQYAAWRVKQIAEEKDPSIIVGCHGGKLMFSTMPKRFVVKYGWLKWLFNLISVEA
jgi:hypothetical protein